jgi:hypothetical protein
VDRFYDQISLSAHWELSLLRLSSISAHEVRALATSWATYKGVTLQEIMQAVECKSHTVFSQFYLRYRWTLADVMSTLGPLVAATSVVKVLLKDLDFCEVYSFY